MDEGTISIEVKGSPTRTNPETNEKRTYVLFREIDSKYPYEVLIGESGPHTKQDWHKHEVIEEIGFVLHGEMTGTIKNEDGTSSEVTLKAITNLKSGKDSLVGVTGNPNGDIVLVIMDENGELREEALDINQGYNCGNLPHVFENRTDNWATVVAVKRTTPEILKANPDIFKKDKITV